MHSLDLDLLTRLLDEHRSALVLFARQRCSTPEDVVQEVFLQLVRQQPLPENVIGWLYRAVRNASISAARAAVRRTHYESAAAQQGEPWFISEEGQRIDAQEAAGALQSLPLEQRETIVARLWGGLSFDEIADLTATTKSTAHRRYVAGLASLRDRFQARVADTLEKKGP
jgi:RNA polymerase sigma-70 factor (ECF subfamily)